MPQPHAPSTLIRCGRPAHFEFGDRVTEIVFVVEEAPEGGYTARAVRASIVTEADDLAGLRTAVRDAVRCHFDEVQRPAFIRLHVVRDELLVA